MFGADRIEDLNPSKSKAMAFGSYCSREIENKLLLDRACSQAFREKERS